MAQPVLGYSVVPSARAAPSGSETDQEFTFTLKVGWNSNTRLATVTLSGPDRGLKVRKLTFSVPDPKAKELAEELAKEAFSYAVKLAMDRHEESHENGATFHVGLSDS